MFFLIILLTVILFIFYKKREDFKDYKSLIVTPQQTIYNDITLNTFYKGSFYEKIAKNFSTIYPITNINYTKGSQSNIELTNKKDNHLSLIQEDILLSFMRNNPKNNVRFISCVGIEQLTLVVPFNSKINKLENIKTIGTLNNKSGSYITLKKILEAFQIESKIVNLDINDITNKFKLNQIDAFFIITSHPCHIIKSLHNRFPIKFLSLSYLNKDIFTKIFPFSKTSIIDTQLYNINSNIVIETINSKILLICNKNLKKNDGYNLIKTIFSNFSYIKHSGNDDYKMKMKDFNPAELYLDNSTYILHKGVKNYYIDIGIITYSDNHSCKYYVGIKKCPNKKLNHFRLL